MKGYIYRIYCEKNQQSYIGQTTNLSQRKKTHFDKLERNNHPNPKLQNSYNKYGKDAFLWQSWEFEITDRLELDLLEINYISKFNSFENGFNLTPGGSAPPNHQILSDEILSYCLCILNYYEWCGHSLEEHFNLSRNVMAPLKRGESCPLAQAIYNSYTLEQKEKYAKKYYKEWGIEEIKLKRHLNKCDNKKIFSLTQEDYNAVFAAQELGYGYTCVAKTYDLKPATVKDWFAGRTRVKNKENYDKLSDSQKQEIMINLPINEFQKNENQKEKLLRSRKTGHIKIAELSGNSKQ